MGKITVGEVKGLVKKIMAMEKASKNNGELGKATEEMLEARDKLIMQKFDLPTIDELEPEEYRKYSEKINDIISDVVGGGRFRGADKST